MLRVSKDRDQLLAEVRDAFRSHGQAGDTLDEAVCRHLGIHRTDARLLDVLHMSGPLSAGELARAGHLSPAAVTAAVDRLERAGYAARRRDRDDRRRVLVAVTPRTEELTAKLYGPLARAGDELLARYGDEQLRLVRDVLRESGRLQLERAERIG